MGYGVLTGDDFAIGETNRDMVREVCVDGWKYRGVAWDRTDAGEQIDSGLERTSEETCTVKFSCCTSVARLWI